MSMTLLSDSDNLSLKMNNPQRYAWHSYQLATPCSSDVALRPASMTNRIQLHWCHFVVDFKRVRIRIHGRLSVRSFKPLSKKCADGVGDVFLSVLCSGKAFAVLHLVHLCASVVRSLAARWRHRIDWARRGERRALWDAACSRCGEAGLQADESSVSESNSAAAGSRAGRSDAEL